jgi:hypothetical protein
MPDYWSASELADRSDAEVIEYIAQFHHGHSAQAEMDRRLMVSMDHSARRLESLTRWLIGLTVVLVILTAVIVALTVVLVRDDAATAAELSPEPVSRRCGAAGSGPGSQLIV